MPRAWKDIAENWENLPLESYKFLFSQAKDRFDDILGESTSLTEKSIGLGKITIVAMSGFVGYNFKTNPEYEWIVLLSFLFLIDLFCVVILMFPKGVIFKGSPPEEIFCTYLDNPDYTETEKTTVIYYHELIRYQERIEILIKKNTQRQLFYGVALITTVLSTLLTAGVIISTIFSHHP
ncbi:hypothetical protein ESA94_13350 [Lacibacter luteus]|uniref:Uncharacterized protein n=1 Tax=Lacibacter luteus TaxID=2508719 RepID=A0A4Q1CI30_9BACT|nr:hypothetical protein [Lacibacter luteus]RXK60027.1 hypothetical protein ESA94_13350 [Lacibacter luteus]